MRPHRRLWWKVRIGDGPWIPNTLRIPQYTIIPREYHSTRRIPQGTTLCHVDLRVKQHDAQNCFAKNTSRCLTNITDHRCLPPQTLFSLQHVWSFPDENPIPNHHSPLHSICSTFSYSKSVNINLGRGGGPKFGRSSLGMGDGYMRVEWIVYCAPGIASPICSLVHPYCTCLHILTYYFVFIIFLFSYSCFPKCHIHVSLFVKYDQKWLTCWKWMSGKWERLSLK